MLDAAVYYAQKADEKSSLSLDLDKKFILCTLHRAENTDDPKRLKNIVDALNKIHSEIEIILPLHPRTKKMLIKHGLSLNVNSIDPVGYFEMIQLLQKCSLVITDSGGLQKEAYFFKKPCVTLRNETEWTELVENGFNELAGATYEDIISKVNRMLAKSPDFTIELYGKGDSATKILTELKKAFS
jgi:UDP-GlcNAc3NAcA epimerase